MKIIEEKIGEIIVLVVNTDRATLNDSEEMKSLMLKYIDANYLKFVIDISACEFIDSTFLGVLVSALKSIHKKNGQLKLVGFKKGVRVMFELTRMFNVFDTHTDLREALSSFG
ncbi:MAG: STAS domain-containing protein [Melioribacteraceae bacterium]|nr:STAS domain-containing protein [Melioribacteraceae bacterium]MCF8412565.1 STAS domain-containing protein [Melioribacteraceae bacterium]MCF8431032.1 STAS domain-containing protein [Melioribacteraceae bacterium]